MRKLVTRSLSSLVNGQPSQYRLLLLIGCGTPKVSAMSDYLVKWLPDGQSILTHVSHTTTVPISTRLSTVKAVYRDFSRHLPSDCSVDVIYRSEIENHASYDSIFCCNATCDGHKSVDILSVEDVDGTANDDSVYNAVVLGGTFDHLHAGHKVLLTEAGLRCRPGGRITVGVTDDAMIQNKTLSALIEPVRHRAQSVELWLRHAFPDLSCQVEEISDPFGPSIVDPDLEAIVCSAETVSGCVKVNAIRQQRSLTSLDTKVVDPVMDLSSTSTVSCMDSKISSVNKRMSLLGRSLLSSHLSSAKLDRDFILRRQSAWTPSDGPYVIGLTGRSGSGKSSVAKRLANLGATTVIDCDHLGHKSYTKGSECYNAIVDAFHTEDHPILIDDGEIDRRRLGQLVFSSESELQKLEAIVWPAIEMMAKAQIKATPFEAGHPCIAVVDAAVLIAAGWAETLCHEIWSLLIDDATAIERIIKRDNKSEEEAKKRLQSAKTCEADMLRISARVLSTKWEYEFTQQQCETAWSELVENLRTRLA